ncbi:hypothetical protein JCM18916_2630 [Cutibacterium acnes JCM 18916]|nr:hypothetical protein TIB1ST10_02585 [Cutibacterium acnes 6609]AER05924.1 hypothetical protein TIIST44_07285 [Cutibacterium acnes subsp. defendens ATCC 11828]ESK57931.1 hypothetical protein PAJL_2393 [Cutibacterium acnes HL042PA3]MCM4178719.1 hypothetical protein [Cutibacterium acnes P03]MCM4179188.1 hypothetical protein [Cutibacterium acnes P15]MCW5109452.1 hypothetical protein [Cutibacterium acnes 17B]GAE73142.1 hypothetical protein JCM18916_2630 [Cutibacterium acnes JCM 18916]GAE76219.1
MVGYRDPQVGSQPSETVRQTMVGGTLARRGAHDLTVLPVCLWCGHVIANVAELLSTRGYTSALYR